MAATRHHTTPHTGQPAIPAGWSECFTQLQAARARAERAETERDQLAAENSQLAEAVWHALGALDRPGLLAAGVPRIVSVTDTRPTGVADYRTPLDQLPALIADTLAAGGAIEVRRPSIDDLSADIAAACGLDQPPGGDPDLTACETDLELTAGEIIGEHTGRRPGADPGCERCATPYGPPHTPCPAHGRTHCSADLCW